MLLRLLQRLRRKPPEPVAVATPCAVPAMTEVPRREEVREARASMPEPAVCEACSSTLRPEDVGLGRSLCRACTTIAKLHQARMREEARKAVDDIEEQVRQINRRRWGTKTSAQARRQNLAAYIYFNSKR